MATILLKRGNGTPTNLQTGEPAVDVSSHRVFIGGGASQGYPLGCQSIPYPKRSATPKIVGAVAGTALVTLTLTASRLYFIPLIVPRAVILTELRISVTTSVPGTASIGIYDNTAASTNDAPNNLLAYVTGLDTGTIGDKTGTLSPSYTLEPGRLYWACLISNAGAALRALGVGSIQTSLGWQVNNTGVISYLYASGSGATLPDPAPTSLTSNTGNTPVIYFKD